jgi:replication factor A1
MDTKQMIEYILEHSDLTESELLKLVAEKKEKVGAGYLTDQGALFLVAADLGVDIEQPTLDMSLKDLYAGAKDINIMARILKIYPIKKITRNDGSSTTLRTLVIYDNDAKVRLTLWDTMAMLPDTLALKVGDIIKVNKAYARSSPDGRVSLSTSSRTSIELVEEEVPHITPIDRLSLDPSDINEENDNLVVNGIIAATPRITSFTNKRGEKSKVLHMQVSNDKSIRVVVWNIDEQSLPKIIKKGEKVRLIGFRGKLNQFGDIELHGDEGSKIELEEDKEEPDIMQLRIVSVVAKDNNALALAIDKEGNPSLLSISNTSLSTDDIKSNMLIECIPSRIYGNTIILDEDSYTRVIEDQDIPTPDMLEVKINDIKPEEDNIYFLEAITLLPPRVQEVQVRDESVNYAETLLGDDTGEIRLVGWRESASMIENINTGKRIKVYGVSASISRDGSAELRLKPFSQIIEVE